MRRMKSSVPSYRLHKATKQAVVTLNGKDFYLGVHNTPQSREHYARILSTWLSNDRKPVQVQVQHTGSALPSITILELVAAFWAHAEVYYRKPDGTVTSELSVFRGAFRVLKQLYGSASASDFGPKALKNVRDEMIRSGWCRRSINKQVGRIKAMFKWAAEQELIPATIFHALQTVSGLKYGRSAAKESDPVRPVPQAFIDAVKSHVSPQVWALIQLQLYTAARPGELLRMRPVDLNTSEEVWSYTPATHKTAHHGHVRTIHLGPKSQDIIKPFLIHRAVDAYLFSPAEAEDHRRATLRENRRTPMTPSQRRRGELAKNREQQRPPGNVYDTDEYRRAIARGCEKADREAHRANPTIPADQIIIPNWHPHQLRHNAATNIRKAFGIETARVILGHKSALVTEIYAEQDHGKAQEVIRKIG